MNSYSHFKICQAANQALCYRVVKLVISIWLQIIVNSAIAQLCMRVAPQYIPLVSWFATQARVSGVAVSSRC